MPMTEDVLMIDPPLPLRMAGIAVRVAKKTPWRERLARVSRCPP
jgi:hypothetical protein